MGRARKLTKTRKKKFLEVLREQANVSQACRAVDIPRTVAYDEKERDSEFAEQWEQAREAAIDRLEAEAWRRAHDGVDEPVFYQGDRVDYITKYSDRLMELLLSANRPDKYKQRWQGDLNASGNLKIELVNYADEGDENTDSS